MNPPNPTLIKNLMDFLTSESFETLATILGLLADTAVLVLTSYTLYITALSKKVELVSPSFSFSSFEGKQMALTFINKSLHTIPIKSVFILKRNSKGVFQHLAFSDYKDPLAINGWSMIRVEMEPFTRICNWNNNTQESIEPHDMINDAVIGVEAGSNLIWVKPYRKAPLGAAKRAYREHKYQMLTVERNNFDGVNLSESVDCVIHVRLKDINGQFFLKRNFGITGFDGGKSVLLSDSILGHNTLPCPGHSAEEIVNTIHSVFGIPKTDINVQMIE